MAKKSPNKANKTSKYRLQQFSTSDDVSSSDTLNDAFAVYNAHIGTDVRGFSGQISPDLYYRSKVTMLGQILELRAEKVVINCLIDPATRAFEVRRFEREILEGAVNLKLGAFLEINIYTKPGERKIVFKSIPSKGNEEIFHTEEIFGELIGSTLFDPLPSTNDDQL